MAEGLSWTTETRRLGDLIPWPRNPRQIKETQARRLVESLDEYGQVETIAIGPDGELYNGHQRLFVWGDRFGPELEVVVRVASRPLTEKEREKLVILLHRGAVGEWDFDMLANEFELQDLLEWGFEERDLDLNLWKGEEPPDAGPLLDRAEELQEKWQVQPGQIWQAGRHRLMCGDCTDPDAEAGLMVDDRAQLGITSPPYAVGKEYEAGSSFEEHLALLRGFADRALELIMPGAFLFVNFGEIASQSHTEPLTGSARQCLYPISKDYWQIFHEERGMDLYAMRVWYKPFSRLQQPFWTYHTSIPHYQEWEHLWTWRLPGGEGDQCHDWDVSSRAVWSTREEKEDDRPLTRHIAAFPLGIPERALRAHTEPGAIVWEPFGGSGTTIVACERLGRTCRAMELVPRYCAVALERLAAMGLQPHVAA